MDVEAYDGIFEQVRTHLEKELFYESPEETAKSLCALIEAKNPALFEQSCEAAKQYVLKYKKNNGTKKLERVEQIL